MFILDFGWFVLSHLLRIISDLLAIILSPFLFLKYYKETGFKKREFKSILITGGTSGIGKELALQFAANGKINLTMYIYIFFV